MALQVHMTRDRPIWLFWGRYRCIGRYRYFQNI